MAKDVVERQKRVQDRLTTAQEVNTKYTNRLEEVRAALSAAREGIDAMGSKMSDAGPLHVLRVALRRIKQDIKEMETRIGVTQSQLWSHRLNMSRDEAFALSRRK